MISIIGAGPIGCYTAYLLAKAGKHVQVFEKKSRIGLPIQCTGLITQKIFNILPIPKELIENRVNQVRVNSKNNSITFKLNKEEIILNRTKFDLYLYNIAKKAGAKFYLNHEILEIKNNNLIVKNKIKQLQIKSDIIIGADGPNSKITKIINKYPHKTTLGMQARIRLNQNPNQYQVFLGKEFGTFSWIVPESKTISKIGIITKDNKKFNNLLKKFKGEILDYPSGVIPIYKKLKLQRNNLFIVGDAAAQIKNTTGGGIIHGLLSAKCLAEAIVENKNYQKIFKKRLKKSLSLHNLIYKTMSSFTDKDFDKLIRLCTKPKIKSIIENTDREHPVKLILQITLNEPRFLLFLPKIMRKV